MVQFQVLGKPSDVDLATELLCAVTSVSRVSPPREATQGGVYRYVTAAIVPDSCPHNSAQVVRQGRPDLIGPTGYSVEYGLCAACQDRVVRVVVCTGGRLSGMGEWSALTETPPTVTTI
jgi:hypothetical protein